MANDSQRRTAFGGMQDLHDRVRDEEARLFNPDPIGSLRLFSAGAPNGRWIPADGSEVSREEYPSLFAKIGITFGDGDGTTTFNVPDAPDVGGVPYYIKS